MHELWAIVTKYCKNERKIVIPGYVRGARRFAVEDIKHSNTDHAKGADSHTFSELVTQRKTQKDRYTLFFYKNYINIFEPRDS